MLQAFLSDNPEDTNLYDFEMCIRDRLKPFYAYYQKQYHCLFQKDIYTNQQWLEIMPQGTSKAHAIEQLKHIYHYDRLVMIVLLFLEMEKMILRCFN